MKPRNSKTENFEVWGLTGGIASGKSTVARIFRDEHGVPVIDADEVARELSAPDGAARPLIRGRFGDLDPTRFKDELRALVFRDPKARKDLEAILHPLIRDESLRRIAEHGKQGHALVIYEATLLFETGRTQDFDGILAVIAGRGNQKARLLARGIGGHPVDELLAERILDAQWTDEQRRASATALIENQGPSEDLRPQIAAFLRSRGFAP